MVTLPTFKINYKSLTYTLEFTSIHIITYLSRKKTYYGRYFKQKIALSNKFSLI